MARLLVSSSPSSKPAVGRLKTQLFKGASKFTGVHTEIKAADISISLLTSSPSHQDSKRTIILS